MLEKSPLTKQLREEISSALEQDFDATSVTPCYGGDINQSFVISNQHSKFFLKLNTPHFYTAFQGEFSSLQRLSDSRAIAVPQALSCGYTTTQSYILLEFLDLSSHASADTALGQQLAKLHRITGSDHGADEDNFIGLSHQPNTKTKCWVKFWQSCRLGYQIHLAEKNHCPANIIQSLKTLNENIEGLFTEYTPTPSLLHGDLWSGNTGVLPNGSPVIFDPASYFGDRETDIAMTELFGGFGQAFYSAYNQAWPLDKGYKIRKPLYQLYHVLNHFNIFGGHYARQADTMARQLLTRL